MSALAGSPATNETPAKADLRDVRGKRRWEAADTVIAASIALVAVIVGIFVLLCFQGYNSTIDNAKAHGQRAASAMAEGSRWAVSTALVALDGVATAIGDDAAMASVQTLRDFDTMAATMPAPMTLAIYDVRGGVIGAASSPGAPASIADRDYFAAAAAGAPFAIGAQEADAAGEADFAVARRLETGGRFAGVAVARIGAAMLGPIAEPLALGAGSTVSIVRKDGWVVARVPSLPKPLNLAGTPAFEQLSAAPSGSYLSPVSPADGIARIVSFQHVDDLDYVALASISLQTTLGELWRAITIVSLLIAPIALALLVGSFLTARLLRRTQSTSRSLAAALEHNQTLFREIHHRVKNNLQSVNSLLQLQPIPAGVRADMRQRIAAMSAVHEHIYRSNTFDTVRVKDYLHTLINNLKAGYDPAVKVVEEIEDVAVDKDAATPLGLIVNEVVSNSFKHAFTDGRHGTISVSLVAAGDGMARLTVRDDGVGYDPAAPATGIGRRLIGGFVAQLKGESAQTNEGGSVFTMTFPLATA